MLNVCKLKLLLAVVISMSVTNVLAAPPIEWVEGQIIVKPRAGLSAAQFEKILNKAQGRSVRKLQQINAHIVKVAPRAEDAVIRALSHNPHIDYAEKDRLVKAPHIPDIRYHMVVALDKAGRCDEARKELDRLLKTGKPFPDVDKARALREQWGG